MGRSKPAISPVTVPIGFTSGPRLPAFLKQAALRRWSIEKVNPENLDAHHRRERLIGPAKAGLHVAQDGPLRRPFLLPEPWGISSTPWRPPLGRPLSNRGYNLSWRSTRKRTSRKSPRTARPAAVPRCKRVNDYTCGGSSHEAEGSSCPGRGPRQVRQVRDHLCVSMTSDLQDCGKKFEVPSHQSMMFTDHSRIAERRRDADQLEQSGRPKRRSIARNWPARFTDRPGMAAASSCFLCLRTWIWSRLSLDRNHQRADRASSGSSRHYSFLGCLLAGRTHGAAGRGAVSS